MPRRRSSSSAAAAVAAAVAVAVCVGGLAGGARAQTTAAPQTRFFCAHVAINAFDFTWSTVLGLGACGSNLGSFHRSPSVSAAFTACAHTTPCSPFSCAPVADGSEMLGLTSESCETLVANIASALGQPTNLTCAGNLLAMPECDARDLAQMNAVLEEGIASRTPQDSTAPAASTTVSITATAAARVADDDESTGGKGKGKKGQGKGGDGDGSEARAAGSDGKGGKGGKKGSRDELRIGDSNTDVLSSILGNPDDDDAPGVLNTEPRQVTWAPLESRGKASHHGGHSGHVTATVIVVCGVALGVLWRAQRIAGEARQWQELEELGDVDAAECGEAAESDAVATEATGLLTEEPLALAIEQPAV